MSKVRYIQLALAYEFGSELYRYRFVKSDFFRNDRKVHQGWLLDKIFLGNQLRRLDNTVCVMSLAGRSWTSSY